MLTFILQPGLYPGSEGHPPLRCTTTFKEILCAMHKGGSGAPCHLRCLRINLLLQEQLSFRFEESF